MTFNSIDFLIFGLLFFILWPLLGKKDNSRWILITVASFIFYGWWDWRFLFLIITSGLIDYFSGIGIANKPKYRRMFLAFSIIGNLGFLSIFKYSSFFAGILESLFLIINIKIDLVNRIPEFALILPVGISFYTFQSLSYTIDIYRGRLKPTRNILHFFSYLSMFPQLVAGPIVRAKDFLQQLTTYRVADSLQKWNAFKLIIYGLFQKMVIADNLAFFVDSAFQGKTDFDGTGYWWVVMVAFSFQIYCDFSGYSLVARGLAKYMGYHFKMNFNHPYLAQSLKDFWARWHISLSTWFRDYVYIPLGGSRQGTIKLILVLSITMLLSGLWHGANYTFLVWAGIHSVFLLIEKFTRWNKKLNLNSHIIIFIIFIQAMFAWVYFRADNIEQGNRITSRMFSFNGFDLDFFSTYFNNLVFLVLAIIIEYSIFLRNKFILIRSTFKSYNLDVAMVVLSILLIVFFRGQGQQFIYFQF